MKEKNCCFTGHRFISGDVSALSAEIEKEIYRHINMGVRKFITGGAIGFDTLAAETVLKVRNTEDIILLLALPCPPEIQTAKWNGSDKKRYAVVLRDANEFVILSKNYYKGCMLKRNNYLVSSSSYCICYLNKRDGGTFYTVNTAKRAGLRITYLGKLNTAGKPENNAQQFIDFRFASHTDAD